VEYVAQQLASFDLLIFINTTRFISELTTAGRPTILVESLAWLRETPPPCWSLLSAYFAQRFFHHPFARELEALENFTAVGAILPASISSALRSNQSPPLRPRSPLVHCGGLFSPAMARGAENDFVTRTFDAASALHEPFRVILPAYLHRRFQRQAAEAIALFDCSPLSVHEQIVGSDFCLTTTGIGFTYESIALGVPTLFLPPFNSSQYFQLEYHRRACQESVGFKASASLSAAAFSALHESTTSLQEVGMKGLWSIQFAEVSLFLDRLRTSERGPLLRAVRDRQQAEFEAITSDGAQRIALHAIRELGVEVDPAAASGR
jgi:hypothetical protein